MNFQLLLFCEFLCNRDQFNSLTFFRVHLHILLKIRAGVFYQDLKTLAEGEVFKSDKTQPASILTGLKSSSSCEID